MNQDHLQYLERFTRSSAKLAHEMKLPMEGFRQLHRAAMGEGVISRKHKELLALGIGVTTGCQGCISFHIREALQGGATRSEIMEALGVAVLMGGGPAVIYACEALEALDQISTQPEFQSREPHASREEVKRHPPPPAPPQPALTSAPEAAPTLHPKTVLVPVDFSPGCEKAARYAVGFARQSHSKLCFLHVLHVPPTDTGVKSVDKAQVESNMRSAAEKQLATWIASTVPEDIPTEALVRAGPFLFELSNVVRNLGVDLIVMTTRGLMDRKHGYRGESETEHVIRHVHCPILALHECEPDFA